MQNQVSAAFYGMYHQPKTLIRPAILVSLI